VSDVLLVALGTGAEPAYPMGLCSMIPLLRASGANVAGLDLDFERPKRVGRAAWVGTSVLPHTAQAARWLIRLAKRNGARSAFVVGVWPSLDPASALRETDADFAIVGPPERAAAALVSGTDPGTIPGVVTRDSACPPVAVRLADLPLMDRRVFPLARYTHAMRSTAVPYAMTFTSRGCCRACPYCPVPALTARAWDARPAEQVADEMLRLAHEHGVRSVHFEDDAFLTDVERAHAIARELRRIGRPASFELVNGIRPEEADPELFRELAASGLARVVFSFEHVSSTPVPGGTSFETARRAVRAARSAGLRVGGYFILGLPGAADAGVRAALALRLDDANFVLTRRSAVPRLDIVRSRARPPSHSSPIVARSGD
jgi:radical SAM superfamily enzyme YgiQ (UPF0313 family)